MVRTLKDEGLETVAVGRRFLGFPAAMHLICLRVGVRPEPRSPRGGVGLQGRWRLFRHDAGRVAGPPALAYVVLYGAAMAVGYWTIGQFGTATVWLANGVVTAALRQLHRRPAIAVLAACAALDVLVNSVRGGVPYYLVTSVVLNLGMAMLAAVLARRVCGAALDLRRPGRLTRFAL